MDAGWISFFLFRQVQHFGFDFLYGRNAISEEPNGREFPRCWDPVLRRALDGGHLADYPDQVFLDCSNYSLPAICRTLPVDFVESLYGFQSNGATII